MDAVGLLYLTLVGLLWGCTNPFMKIVSKSNSEGLNNVRYRPVHAKLALLINLLGSGFYSLILRQYDLSLCVPIANSAALLFTIITSWMIGERKPNIRVIVGLGCISCGLVFLIYDFVKKQSRTID